MRTLVFEINCGETTCASARGKFCEWVGTSRFGTQWHCMLFNKELSGNEDGGWLQRCDECVHHERSNFSA